MEQLIKRHVVVAEIETKTDKSLFQRYYYDLFCRDVVTIIKYMANLYLHPYDPMFINKIVIGEIKDFYLHELPDIKDYILFGGRSIDREIKETETIPVLFEIIDLNLVFDSIGKAIDSTLICAYRPSIYFDFFIVNEKTMFLKYEAYQCQ